VPAMRAAAVWDTVTASLSHAVLATVLPDERNTTANAGNLGCLGVTFNLALTEIQAQLLLGLW